MMRLAPPARTLLSSGLLSILLLSFPSLLDAREAQRAFPVPETVSPAMQKAIGAGALPGWNAHPASAEEWKALVKNLADETIQTLPALRQKLGVTSTPGFMGGIPIFTIVPRDLPEANKDRFLLHLHGGGYVLQPGEAGTKEAILMAGLGKFKVISVDYRMAPDFPYPAAIDDAMAVYRDLLRSTSPEKIGVFGTSTGGAMTLILALRARQEGLPLPAALAAGTPWSDLTKTGDSYFTNDGVDNVLVSYEGWLGDAARIYANGHDMKDPLLSPIHGDVSGFPPTMLTSGTRDLFLSNTVRMHLKMRQAGVPADLVVFEGQSHAHYSIFPDAPENRFHFEELGRFFGRHLR